MSNKAVADVFIGRAQEQRRLVDTFILASFDNGSRCVRYE